MTGRVKAGLMLTAIVILVFLAVQGAHHSSAPAEPVSPALATTENALPSAGGPAAETGSGAAGARLPRFDRALEWPLAAFQAPALWDRTEGAGVKVAVVDTGVDADQPDLAGTMARVIDLTPGARGDESGNSHGTAVAGLIAAPGSATGPAHMVGLAPQALLIDIRVTSQPAEVNANDIAAGITQAVEAGARVINVSLGAPRSNPRLRQALALAQDHGCLVVASAGDGGKPQYPAASDRVLAVAASSQNSAPLTSLNGYGPHAIYAPGADLYSTAETGAAGGGHDGYISDLSGSDYATAYVSAAAALLFSDYPQLSAQEAGQVLIKAAAPAPSAPGPGILDPLAALQDLRSVPPIPGTSASATAEPNPRAMPHATPATAAPGYSLGPIGFTAIAGLAAIILTVVVIWLITSRQRPPHTPFSWDEPW